MRKITSKLKSDMIFDLHTLFGDGSDPYAARGAQELTDALTKPENSADLETYMKARTKVNRARTEVKGDLAYNEYAEVVYKLVDKYIPDNWSKRDLNWPKC